MREVLADVTLPTDGIAGYFTMETLTMLLAVLIIAAAVIAIWRSIPKWVLVLLAVIITMTVLGFKAGG